MSPPIERAAERAAKVRFRRAMSLMAMTLVAPGSAQLTAGNRRLGLIAFRVWLGVIGLGLVTLGAIVFHRQTIFWIATDTSVLLGLRLGLLALAVAWAYLFVDAWRIGQPLSYGLIHRRVAVGVNGLLCFSVAGTLLFGAHLVGVQRDFIITVFGNGSVTGAHDGRYNVLLMGGDSGAGRWGLRPDSMTIASIDADTGRTVLVGLPRNMSDFPFADGSVMAEQFPHGFIGAKCGDYCYLNGVNTWAMDHQDLFKHTKNPGIDATMSAITGITGLSINYWAMVNLQGFKDLVNAVGGVTLKVRQPIPVGGLGADVVGYVPVGTRKLDGMQTLWYARARDGSDDYSRMARQKCVMNAMLQQVSPQTAVTNFQAIEKATSGLITTDLPASEVDHFMALALKARTQKVSVVSLVPPKIVTAHPDIDLIRSMVTDAIDKAEGTAPKPVKAKHQSDSVVTGGSIGSLSTGYAANQAGNLDTAC